MAKQNWLVIVHIDGLGYDDVVEATETKYPVTHVARPAGKVRHERAEALQRALPTVVPVASALG